MYDFSQLSIFQISSFLWWQNCLYRYVYISGLENEMKFQNTYHYMVYKKSTQKNRK